VDDETGSNHLRHFIHYTCPTLAHFVALLCRPTDSCIPGNTSLVVIDSLSALLNHNFPRVQEGKGSSGKGMYALAFVHPVPAWLTKLEALPNRPGDSRSSGTLSTRFRNSQQRVILQLLF
jgi:hypothetical protein